MKNKSSMLFVVIPAYNEAANIRQVIADWYPVVEKFGGEGSRLVIFDDGSRDETYSIMLEEKKIRPLFEPVTKPNSGHGATVLMSYHYAVTKIVNAAGGGGDLFFKQTRTDRHFPVSLKNFGS